MWLRVDVLAHYHSQFRVFLAIPRTYDIVQLTVRRSVCVAKPFLFIFGETPIISPPCGVQAAFPGI